MTAMRPLQGRSHRSGLRISLIYLIIGVLWILFSDSFLYLITKDQKSFYIISTFKGWIYISITALVLYFLIRRDIIVIEQSERSRLESEMGYKKLADSITDVFFALDSDLRYVYWNKASEKFTGITEKDALGKHIYELFPNIFGTKGEKMLKEVLRTQQPDSFSKEYLLNGRQYSLDISMYPSKNGLSVFVKDSTGRKRIEEELQESVERLQVVLNGTVEVLASVAEKKDPYIAGHQRRVSKLAVAIAQEMGLPESQIEGLRVAGILHDIGKISVPAEILNKPGPLSEHEFRIVQIYPRIGHDILKTIQFPWPVAKITLQHQEKMDGSGYPAGISGSEIVLEARIIAVADFIDAMSSHRPYRTFRQKLGIDHALEELGKYRGTRYDANVVNAALALFNKGFTLDNELS